MEKVRYEGKDNRQNRQEICEAHTSREHRQWLSEQQDKNSDSCDKNNN